MIHFASAGSVDIAAVAETDHRNHQAGIDDHIQDPEVADTHSAHRLLAGERNSARVWGSSANGSIATQIPRCFSRGRAAID